jgi:soluble lytic murein transglycosylase-like protein
MGRVAFGIALIGLLAASTAARARGLTCWDMASLRYGVPVEILVAIAKQESNFNAKAISPPNSNGSRDIGMMQINEWWLPKLEAYGITREKLLDPCINLNVGAWILSQEFERHGYTWKAIGAYNAKSPDKRLAYAKHILKHLKTIEQNKQRAGAYPR